MGSQERRIDVGVGVAYGTPPEKMLDILLAVARAHPLVLPREPLSGDQPSLHLFHAPAQHANLIMSLGVRECHMDRLADLCGRGGQ